MDSIRTIREKRGSSNLQVLEDSFQTEVIWETLESLGISKEKIIKQNLSHEQLFEIHCAVRTYLNCQRQLKDLTRCFQP